MNSVVGGLAFVTLFSLLSVAAGVAALAVLGPALTGVSDPLAAFLLTAVAVMVPVVVVGAAFGALLLRALWPQTRVWGLRRRAGACALGLALSSVVWGVFIYTGFATVLEATVLTAPAAGCLVLLLSRPAQGYEGGNGEDRRERKETEKPPLVR